MLESLYEETTEFETNFLEIMNKLAVDVIPVVKISLAISIQKIISHHKIDKSKFSELIEKLSMDAEVAEYFNEDPE